jgi:HK97 family phage prohead protease
MAMLQEPMMSKTDLRLYGSIEEFRQAAKTAQDGDASNVDARVRASLDTEVKVKDGVERTLTFSISTASVDRMGDTIAVDGWKLDSFRKNPVVLWAHDSSGLPVAKAPKIWIEGEKLMADAEFTPPGMARFNDVVFEMYKQGFLSATSVGFMPLKYAFTEDPKRRFGIDFLEQELLEFSMVPVPANAEALIEGRSAGIDVAPVLDWCEDQIKRCADSARIIKLAESVLGSGGDDVVALAWAERIVGASGKAVVSRERIEKIERAARAERLRRKAERDLDVIRARGF